jgi:TolA-binding protein
VSRRAEAIVGLGLALVAALLSGCRTGAEKGYRRAEWLLAQDRPQLAAQEYERLVKAYPHHALAANALYRLAYLYRGPLNDQQRALQWYELLATQYPRSSLADDALFYVAYLSRTEL